MGAMKDYCIWLEEKGYIEWDDLNGGWIDLVDKDKAWAEYQRTQQPRWSSPTNTVSDVIVTEDPSIDT